MHTYATVADFRDFLRDDGATILLGDNPAPILAGLEAVSRNVVSWCGRNRDFGPRIGTNRYIGDGRPVLPLGDDLIDLDTLTVDGTEVLNAEQVGRKLTLPSGVFSRGALILATGTWGYSDETFLSAATLGDPDDDYDVPLGESETSVQVSDAARFAPGHTLRIDDEQLYVREVGDTLTVVRGVNGTEAAEHAYGSLVEVFLYPPEIKQAVLMVMQRRWRMRDAGVTADFGGGDMPIVGNRDQEQAILRSVLGNEHRFLLVR